jgi:hypothetical protein
MAFWWSFVAKDDAFEDIVCALGACFNKLPVDMEHIYWAVSVKFTIVEEHIV